MGQELLPILNTLLLILGSGVGVYFWKAERKLRFAQAESQEAEAVLTNISAADMIKTMAIGLLEPLNTQIEEQKDQIDRLTTEVNQLRNKLQQYIKDEVAYQAELHQKNKEIASLEQRLEEIGQKREQLESRILHLEEVCRRAGINGYYEEVEDGLA